MGNNGTRVEGRILAVVGPVGDVEFPPDQLPQIYDAIEIPLGSGSALVCEVQQHLGDGRVRAVAMSSTDGLRRGMTVRNTGAPISVPVGPDTLGRIFNVLGQPIDMKGDVKAVTYYPIHRLAPLFVEQSTQTQVFETGADCARLAAVLVDDDVSLDILAFEARLDEINLRFDGGEIVLGTALQQEPRSNGRDVRNLRHV